MTLGTLLGVTVPFALTITVLSFASMRADAPEREAQFRAAISATADRIALAVAGGVQWGDLGHVEQTLQDFLAGDTSLGKVEVIDPTGQVVASASARRVPDHPMVVSSDLRRNGASLGTLRATFDAHSLDELEDALRGAATGGIAAAVLMAALIALWVGWTYRRTYRRVLEAIRASAQSLEGSVARLQGASTSQSAYSAQSASAIAETQAVASEVGGAAATGVQRAAALAEVGSRTDEEAERAIAAVVEARDALEKVGEQTTAIGVAIRSFADRGAQIGEIATTVAGLADRSNLLALNAAIEASRAGESGKAFSVVSREMRKLAEATNRSAATVKTLVGEVQDEVSRWTDDASAGGRQVGAAMQRAAGAVDALRGFAGATRTLAELSRGLATGGADQRTAIDSTVEAMKQATAAGAEQLDGVRSIESASARLRELATALVGALAHSEEGTPARTVRRLRAASPLARRLLRRTLLTTVGTYALITFAIGGVIMSSGATRTWKDPRPAITLSADSLAVALRDPTERMDRPAARALLASAQAAAPLLYGQVLRADGTVVASLGARPPAGPDVETARRELRNRDGRLLGTVELSHSLAEARAEQVASNWRTFFIILASVGVTALMTVIVARRFGTRFESILDHARHASTELDSLVSSLAAAAAQQSSSMAEAAAALQETHASAAEVRKGAAAASERAGALVAGGASAETQTGEVIAAIEALRDAVAAARGHGKVLADAIASFSARAAEISDVATTVALLAERSDLLAVNASIESARGGGSATSGFMVVAEEIRSLADGSARAAQQVKAIVDAIRVALSRAQVDASELQHRLEGAEAAAHKARDGVGRFAEVTRQFVRLGNDLGVSASQQENAVDQMAGAVAEAADGARTQAESTREVEAVAQGLVALSRGLVDVAGGQWGTKEAAA